MRIAEGLARKKIDQLKELFDPCRLCPRQCGIHRLVGEIGVCGAGSVFRMASWAVHRGEEPPISGTRGSGTIFTSHCPMKCRYCQNFPFSQLGNGGEFTIGTLAESMVKLVKKGVHNINLVTATHFSPYVFEALLLAWTKVKPVPVVWNTSGYESIELLQILEGMVDVYLPDIRYADNETANRYSNVIDYVERDRAAISEMFRQVGFLETDEQEIATKGIIIRHLVLPGGLSKTRESLTWLKETLGPKVHLSLMCQYFPAHLAPQIPEINRRITEDEYLEALNIVEDLEFENVWAQDPYEEGGA